MRVESLRLRDFRNLAAVEFVPDPRFNVIVGPNGQGKTNLLESIYFLAALKSFRSLKNAALVREGCDRASLSAWIDRGGVRREVKIVLTPRSRKVRLNDNVVRRLSDFFGVVNTVAFVPEDVSVMKASPGARRTFFDRMVFNAWPAYATEVSDYESALKQRNALIRDGHVSDRSTLAAFDAEVVRRALVVIERRTRFVAELSEPFERSFAEIFGPGFDPRVTYRMRFADEDPEHDRLLADRDALADALSGALRHALPRDLARGHTTVGPHRDDFVATLGGRPMREFASQGQHRAFVLALKTTEIRLSEQRMGHCPILLLDDVSSELDPNRNARLFDFLSTIDGQVFITTTDDDYVRLNHSYRRWSVRDGGIEDG